ncbi:MULTISPECIES: hypothetical protein [unclassified Acinetobacter]|uniref:hypothetical protein n=1 Tax=unclassified Acinetobacter TaxID=196816 RepID=UPI00257877F4|nr:MULTISPECIES: hypothetical protein [unclassified Acinetobacter]MDM1758015.1 hypothetical protein [Acinetobacter sp. 256-1]MDM1761148.1 hypothetical protein [Acinetobacter sp. 251-1]
MDDKKIYKILQHWFPLLKNAEIPKKKYRKNFSDFLQWIKEENFATLLYMMKMQPDCLFENEMEQSAVLQDFQIDLTVLKDNIAAKADPILAYFEQHKAVIGRYYDVNEQILDILLEEVLTVAEQIDYQLLLVYAEAYYWLLVPNDEAKIEKFCKSFNQQFKDHNILIEHYERYVCSRST